MRVSKGAIIRAFSTGQVSTQGLVLRGNRQERSSPRRQEQDWHDETAKRAGSTVGEAVFA